MAGPEVVRCRDCAQEIEFGVAIKSGKRVPIEPSRMDFSKDPRATHAGFEHPVTGRLMIHRLAPGDHINPDAEQMVLLHRFACPKSPTFTPAPEPTPATWPPTHPIAA